MTAQYRLAPGSVTAAVLTADADSIVKAWTSTLNLGWTLGPSLVNTYVEARDAMSGIRSGFGLLHWTWTIGRMDSAMFDVLRTEIFSSGILSADVTARTYAKGWVGGSQWITVQAQCTWAGLYRADLQLKAGDMFVNTVLQFKNGVIAPSGA